MTLPRTLQPATSQPPSYFSVLDWLAMETLRQFENATGEHRTVTLRYQESWARCADPEYPDAPPLVIDWPYNMTGKFDEHEARRILIPQVLERYEPVFWEHQLEARLVRGVLAYRNAAENLAIDLYRRVHLS